MLAVAFWAAGPGAIAASVYISEFMASNESTLPDNDGVYSDWIEIHNASNTTVTLSGWFLTDSTNNLTKWRFPAVSLTSGARMVVFASNEDRRNPLAPLHTNFKLDAGGEPLLLVRPDGVTVEHGLLPAFPPQAQDVAYGYSDASGTNTVLASGAAVRAAVPTSSTHFATSFAGWETPAFQASAWTSGTSGVGYDTGGEYSGLIGLDVQGPMRGLNASVFLRQGFVASNVAQVASVWLRAKWDDGFRAYLNGTAVAEADAPAGETWNAVATGNRDEQANESWTWFAVTNGPALLVEGTNVLAIHGFNVNTNSSDMLVLPEVDLVRVAGPSGAPPAYLASPTPGAPNSAARGAMGPVIRGVTDRPPRPLGTPASPPVLVTAEVTPSLRPVGSVTLAHRTMFGAETLVAMTVVSGSTWRAEIPTAALPPGHMLRWRVIAVDNAGATNTAPPYLDPLDADQYCGTVALDPAVTNSRLPVIHWFVPVYTQVTAVAGGRTSMFHLDRFYDNVLVSRHGQSTAGFSKKSFNLDYNDGNRFLWREGEGKVKDVKWLTNWGDKTKTHNTLAHEIAGAIGAGHHFATPIRLQTNGGFYSVADMVEDADDRWLDRLGLDPEGALYKMYNALNAASGNEKKTRATEGTADLQAVVTGLSPSAALAARRRYAYDNLDLAACVSYFVGRNLNSDQDHGHKNYYLYRDTLDTGEWSILQWDTDLSYGRNWTQSNGYLHDLLWQTNPLSFYPGSAIQSKTTNRLYQLFWEVPEFRAMYLRRLRSAADEVLQPPGTPAQDLRLERRFDELADLIDPPGVGTNSDAYADYLRWGSWGTNTQMRAEIGRTKAIHLPGRREFIYSSPTANIGGERMPDAQPGDVTVGFGVLDAMPAGGDPDGEYFTLVNTNAIAVDISGWSVTGGVRHVFRPGTVIPPGGGGTENIGALYVARRSAAFRGRPSGPASNQFCFVQQGYQGRLSMRGEPLHLLDPTGRLVAATAVPAAPTPCQVSLRISKLMYNPPGPTAGENAAIPFLLDTDFEFIELVNTGTNSLDLGGARFVQGVDFIFASNTVLAAGARLVVVANAAAFALRYGTHASVAGAYAGSLDNGGETLQLLDSRGEEILEFTYKDGWAPITDGLGFALVIDDESGDWTTWDEKTSWRTSGLLNGSPGLPDPGPPVVPAVVIDEALAHTDPPLLDAIELLNPSGTAANVGGWYLTDDFYVPRKFRIPAGTEIAPGGRVLFDASQFNADSNSPSAFQLSSTGDAVWLFSADASSNLTGYVHGFGFGASPNGVSFGRHVTSEGEEHFVAQSSRTLGQGNAGPRVGPIVISEIMYHPQEGGTNEDARLEFIEVRNIGDSAVALHDPAAPTNRWRLAGAVEFDLPPGTQLAAGSSLIMVGFDPAVPGDSSFFRTAYPSASNAVMVGPWSGRLANSGEAVELYMPDSPNPGGVPWILIERVAYGDGEPWPAAADGGGASLQRIAEGAYADDSINWFAARPSVGLAADLAADGDGDGSPDWAERRAGTDAGDPRSRLVLTSVRPTAGGGVEVGWPGVSGKRYAIESTTNLAGGGPFDVEASGVPGSGAGTVQSVPQPGPLRVFRVRVEP